MEFFIGLFAALIVCACTSELEKLASGPRAPLPLYANIYRSDATFLNTRGYSFGFKLLS